MKQNSSSSILVNIIFTLLLLSGMYGCGGEEPESLIRTVEDEQAEEYARQLREELSPSTADGLEVSLWASEELVGDPVALHVDHLGRVLVTNTERRRDAELDIRGHRDWMIESVTFESVEDRRAFVRRELAPERSEENPWLTDHNEDGSRDWHDLTVNKESIFRLEDLTGNGHANRARLFARDFYEEVTDVAGAVLYHQGEVFVGVAPDLWRLRDGNGDGQADARESISHGYGVNIGFAGHGMSGLTVGPAGRIYWSIGDRGASVVDKDGKKWHHPREGVIVRAEPDGSDFEVFARGLRNTHEFTFDKYGNLITVDNDGDHAGESERLVYLVSGSDSGWRVNWQFGKYNDPKNNDYKVLMDEGYYKPRFEGQAAHLLPPLALFHDGPAGMAYNPGTALGGQWKDHFFIAEFVGSPTRSGIHAFTLRPSGASFELDRDEQIMEGLLATGLAFGPDGALYFADWIEGWALNAKGRIWKLDAPDEAASELRVETKNLLAGDVAGQPSEALLELLGHPDMRVRQKAQFELAGRDDRETFAGALADDHQLKRIHGIWGLAQIARRNPEAADPLIPLLGDEDAEIRAQAAKMLGDVRYEAAAEELTPLLGDENARVRFFAAEALGRLAWRPALEPIVEMLQANDDRDVYLRHGGAIALARIGDADALVRLSGHPSRAVRIAAVVALKRLEHPGVVRFLADEDEFVVTNAARAINDDGFIEEGLEALAGILEQERFTDNEPLLRRAINANLYRGTEQAAERLAAFALRSDIAESLRAEALKTLSAWEMSSELDRVTGDPRGRVENNPEQARQAIALVIADILADEPPEVKMAGLQAVASLRFTPAAPEVMRLITEDSSPEVRIASLQALADMEYEGIGEAVFAALEDPRQRVRMNALQAIPDLSLPDEKIVALIEPVLEHGTVEERQAALTVLGRIEAPGAYELLDRHLQQLTQGELDQEVELELLQAAESAGSQAVRERLQAYRSQQAGEDSVSAYRASLYGGDAGEGRRIFYRDASAQCIRCHAVDGQGSQVGPDLSTVGSRLSREELLQSMVDPDARLSPGYGSVALTLDGGQTVHGILREESDTRITLASGGGDTVVDKTDIAERTNSPSGMPAMGEVLSPGELRDLVEFLTTLQGSED